jgi:hypothetical protein
MCPNPFKVTLTSPQKNKGEKNLTWKGWISPFKGEIISFPCTISNEPKKRFIKVNGSTLLTHPPHTQSLGYIPNNKTTYIGQCTLVPNPKYGTNCQQTYEPILVKGKLSTYLMRVETRERERETQDIQRSCWI